MDSLFYPSIEAARGTLTKELMVYKDNNKIFKDL